MNINVRSINKINGDERGMAHTENDLKYDINNLLFKILPDETTLEELKAIACKMYRIIYEQAESDGMLS